MPAPICTTLSTILCPHGGQLLLKTSQALFRIQEAPVLLVTDVHDIGKCPYTIPGTPPIYSPCVKCVWSAGALQTKVFQIPVLLQTSVGRCFNSMKALQGYAVISQVQPFALGL